ncbi:phosphotransferase [Herbaspirillum rubrisubalbicans]|uniref:Phosphotransferase n=2 Tax=Herbaspirillum rubrisubalbicans TaxID=80842 RepID=A0ABX9C0R7_9BURK|nr:Hpt domain-containing protein [Herbaspirillum rubrisubalbicans]MCP1574230.1 HPt (histidine-containing phosphotransfer) domain-containing protein [Herbaspirillum rubrisubalbicans]QJQ02709.1 phosphotransferase [Herbaspirillum rubrisubalbicans Os34]RAM63955.1 phosphotransferase [Herbaspirillum rubrisubalbicans]RAN46954.1 phosphotransferase [Herbaspirillum rubrisubalbicans]
MHLGQSTPAANDTSNTGDYHHIDPSHLLDAVGGDVHTVASLARTFLAGAPAIFLRLEQAILAGNAAASQHESHTLKGMCALFQAKALTELLHQTEQAGRDGCTPEPEQLQQLQTSFALVQEEIERYARSAPQS